MTAVDATRLPTPSSGHGTTAPVAAFGTAQAVMPEALSAAIGRLDAELREMSAYLMGLDGDRGCGKLVRPAFVLACAEAVGGPGADAVPAAVAVELIHNASLVHDDIMDGDAVRRGRPTVWRRYDESRAILVGDALIALAFEIVSETSSTSSRASGVLAAALRRLAVGQGADLRFERGAWPSVAQSIDMVSGKTGALIGCACRLGALSAGADARVEDGLERFGHHVGVAFQIVDDLLGIWGDPDVTAKSAESDLQARKKTVPVVAALHAGGPDARRLGERLRRPGRFSADELAELAELIERTGARRWANDEVVRRVASAVDEAGRVGIHPAEHPVLDELLSFMVRRTW